MRWWVAWDSAGHAVWNGAALVVFVAALASWWTTPRGAFPRAGTGRWWVLLTIGATAAIGGFWVPVGPVAWFVYWLPRLNRRREPAAPAAGASSLGIPGEPLI